MISDLLWSCTDAFRSVSHNTVVTFPTSNGVGILSLIRQNLINLKLMFWRTRVSFKTWHLNKVMFLTDCLGLGSKTIFLYLTRDMFYNCCSLISKLVHIKKP